MRCLRAETITPVDFPARSGAMDAQRIVSPPSMNAPFFPETASPAPIPRQFDARCAAPKRSGRCNAIPASSKSG